MLLRVRVLLVLFMAGLVLAGVTAIPLVGEVDWLARVTGASSGSCIGEVREALVATEARYPFLAYGTDWLAFGHLVVALAFVGAVRDPVRNVWVVEFGMIACALVVPFALVFGAVRGIPFWWRLVDCSFGVLGFPVLWVCRRWIGLLERSASCTVGV